tara:strand:- start:19 stop:231 length:213 start_codon:yes stop_codon:yes gene_type:complete
LNFSGSPLASKPGANVCLKKNTLPRGSFANSSRVNSKGFPKEYTDIKIKQIKQKTILIKYIILRLYKFLI